MLHPQVWMPLLIAATANAHAAAKPSLKHLILLPIPPCPLLSGPAGSVILVARAPWALLEAAPVGLYCLTGADVMRSRGRRRYCKPKAEKRRSRQGNANCLRHRKAPLLQAPRI